MKFYLLFTLLLIGYSCNQSQKTESDIFEINPEEFSEDKFTLSDIADDIRYIPLDNKFPIGLIYSIEMNDKAIYLSTKNAGIIQMDRNGNYIQTIAKNGRGPDEYIYGHNFVVDEESSRFYIVDRGKIKVYSAESNCVNDISIENHISGTANGIEFLDKYLFIPDYGTYGKMEYNWMVIDTLGNIINTKEKIFKPGGYVEPGSSYMFDNKLYYYNTLNDTIFSISPDLNVDIAYLFSQGDYRWPKEGFNLESTTGSELLKMFRVLKMFESKHFIFMTYSFKGRTAFLLIEKSTQKTYQAYLEKKVGLVSYIPNITNDLDGGMPVKDLNYYLENKQEYIYTFIQPVELKLYISGNEFKSSTPKYPEKKKELKKLANSLSENDNPVLMLVKLKE